MKWGLSQGLIGQDQLVPSFTAIGPNTYLTRNDFAKMLGIAVAVHAIALGVAGLMPSQTVTDIPVRALSFKLGDQDKVAAYGRPSGAGESAAPVATSAQIAPPILQAITQAPVEPAERVAPTLPAPKPKPVLQPKPQPKPKLEEPTPAPKPAPAIAATPQQYVREVGKAPAATAQNGANTGYGVNEGAIGGSGLESSQTAQTTEAVRQRYEQQISSWIERHKITPEGIGHEVRVVVRMQIDRGGVIRYYALEQPSGIQAVDAAAIDMVRRANPVPPVPANYPAGTLIEFIIPIVFAAP